MQVVIVKYLKVRYTTVMRIEAGNEAIFYDRKHLLFRNGEEWNVKKMIWIKGGHTYE